MGQLDTWSQRAIRRREGRVEFLGEHSGSLEDTLKRDLILEFATRPDIRRAYLARVSFPPESKPSTALCIVSSRPDDRAIVTRIGEIFRRCFAKDETLDVLFITTEQEGDLARVCRPFYSGAG